jgi:hypothetical protein
MPDMHVSVVTWPGVVPHEVAPHDVPFMSTVHTPSAVAPSACAQTWHALVEPRVPVPQAVLQQTLRVPSLTQ